MRGNIVTILPFPVEGTAILLPLCKSKTVFHCWTHATPRDTWGDQPLTEDTLRWCTGHFLQLLTPINVNSKAVIEMDWFRPAEGEGTRTVPQGTGQAATVTALLPYAKDSTTLPKL